MTQQHLIGIIIMVSGFVGCVVCLYLNYLDRKQILKLKK